MHFGGCKTIYCMWGDGGVGVYNSENYKCWEAKGKNLIFYLFFQNKCKHSVEDNSCNIQNISAIVGNVKYLKKISMIKENVKNNNKQFLHSTTQDCAASYLQLYTGTNVQISSEVFSTSTEE